MESTPNAPLNEPSQTFDKDTGGPLQIPDQSTMLTEAYDPADLSDPANGRPATPTDQQETATRHDNSGRASGSPNMEPDTTNYGNGDSLGNNDGTEPDPEQVDLV